MSKRILVIQGHPEVNPQRLCRGLAARYEHGARSAGHTLRSIDVGTLDFPLLRSRDDFYADNVPEVIAAAQRDIEWAETVVLFFPIWLGAMPALLKGFLEQVCRPAFTFPPGSGPGKGRPRLGGRSAHLVVTMGMPSWVYRFVFGAKGVRGFASNLKVFTGIRTRRITLVGGVVDGPAAPIERWLVRLEALGRAGG
jgi:putative NADPH-quinone reductase